MKLRKSLHHLFEKHEVSWEVFMVFLALAYVVIAFILHLEKLSPDALRALDDVGGAITLFFALEFTVRLTVAPSRKVYIKEHWLDIVALLPVIRWLRLGRLARVIRLLRFAKLARVFGSFDRLKDEAVRFAEVNGLQWMLLILTGVMFVSSVLLFLFEYPYNDKIKTYWDALYAALVTWTTPGYGDIAPITTAGRICGLVLITSGLITWGLLIANLAAFLATRRRQGVSPDPAVADIQDKLSHFSELTTRELVSLRGAVTALIENRLGDQDTPSAADDEV